MTTTTSGSQKEVQLWNRPMETNVMNLIQKPLFFSMFALRCLPLFLTNVTAHACSLNFDECFLFTLCTTLAWKCVAKLFAMSCRAMGCPNRFMFLGIVSVLRFFASFLQINDLLFHHKLVVVFRFYFTKTNECGYFDVKTMPPLPFSAKLWPHDR